MKVKILFSRGQIPGDKGIPPGFEFGHFFNSFFYKGGFIVAPLWNILGGPGVGIKGIVRGPFGGKKRGGGVNKVGMSKRERGENPTHWGGDFGPPGIITF